jgi:hypothetical protein
MCESFKGGHAADAIARNPFWMQWRFGPNECLRLGRTSRSERCPCHSQSDFDCPWEISRREDAIAVQCSRCGAAWATRRESWSRPIVARHQQWRSHVHPSDLFGDRRAARGCVGDSHRPIGPVRPLTIAATTAPRIEPVVTVAAHGSERHTIHSQKSTIRRLLCRGTVLNMSMCALHDTTTSSRSDADVRRDASPSEPHSSPRSTEHWRRPRVSERSRRHGQVLRAEHHRRAGPALRLSRPAPSREAGREGPAQGRCRLGNP